MKIGGLFFGYGGLDLAVQSVYPGAELAWYSEFDKGANKIAAHRFPGVPNHGDITKIDWASVEPIDILTGGSPCQDLSHAGARKGMTEGTRSNLWVAMREAIAQLRPQIVVWENVRGAFSAAADSEVEPCPGCVGDGSGVHLRALGRVLGDLSDLGYDTRWHGLRAADVGAPHGRFRVFVVATDARGNAGQVARRVGAAGRHSESGGGGHDGPLLPTPRSSDSNGAGQHGEGGVDLRTAVSLMPTPRASDGTKGGPNQRGSSGDLMLSSAVALLPTPSANDFKGSTATRRREGMDRSQLDATLEGRAARGVVDWGGYAAAIERWEPIVGRPAPEPTMLSTKGNPQLSPRFVEWLMGLPTGWVTVVPGITRNEALKALGNGVVPQQAAEALRVMASWSEVAA